MSLITRFLNVKKNERKSEKSESFLYKQMAPYCVQLWTNLPSKKSGNESRFLISAPVQVLKEEGNC